MTPKTFTCSRCSATSTGRSATQPRPLKCVGDCHGTFGFADTWTGNISLTTGGNRYNIESQADTLNISGNISQVSGTGSRFLNFMGSGNTNVTGQILDGTASIVLTKTGGGSLTLSGNNNYTGATTVNAGILQIGDGTPTAGTLGADSDTSIASGATLRINRTGTAGQALTYGGALSGTGTVEILSGARIDFTADQAGSGNLSFIVDGSLAIRTAGPHNVQEVHLGELSGAGVVQRGGGTGGSATVVIGGKNTDSNFFGNIISPELGIEKVGTGSLMLAGNNTYGGTTNVNAGTLLVNGNNSGGGLVTVAAGGTLGGTGTIASTITGAGLVSPGNSPGILTVGQVDPSLDLNFAFEFTAPGSPDYINSAASINDVLRITHATDPFTSALTGSNTVDLYLNVATLETDVFRGGFYTDRGSDFWGDISAANFNVWVLGDGMGGAASFGGNDYYSFSQYLPGALLEMSTVSEAASFNGGPVGGYVFQLSVVPEPDTFALGLLAAVGVALLAWRRRR